MLFYIDKDKICSDLMTNYSVISEGIQTILRKHGDEQAYVELVNRYKDRLMNFVYRFVNEFTAAIFA